MSDEGRATARQWPAESGRLVVVAPSIQAAEAWATEQGLDAGRWVGVYRSAGVRQHVQDGDEEFAVVPGADLRPVVEALLQRGKRRREE